VVAVAEEESVDQALARLDIDQLRPQSVWQFRRLRSGGCAAAAASSSVRPTPSAASAVGIRAPCCGSYRIAHNRHYALYEQDGGEGQSTGDAL
jgi:hypothetical protein